MRTLRVRDDPRRFEQRVHRVYELVARSAHALLPIIRRELHRHVIQVSVVLQQNTFSCSFQEKIPNTMLLRIP